MNISQGGGSQGSFSERASAGASNMLDSAKRLLGVETQPRTWLDELEERCCGCCPSFTWQQRLFGCLLCFVIGAFVRRVCVPLWRDGGAIHRVDGQTAWSIDRLIDVC